MRGIEFFQANSRVFYSTRDGRVEELTEGDVDLVDYLYERISEEFPAAYCALVDEFSRCRRNVRYFRWRVVDRFVRCNFGRCDNVEDVDIGDDWHLEFVECPLRGCCRHENVVCLPRRATSLTRGELRVGAMLLRGVDRRGIADGLCLSPYTVENHIRHIYGKLGVHTEADFVRVAKERRIFENYEIQ